MPRYIDAEELKATVKANDWSNPCVPIVVNMIIDRSPSSDVVEVVRCKDCDVPRNSWTGCPNLNGMIPPPEFFCAKGVRKPKTADATAAGNGD